MICVMYHYLRTDCAGIPLHGLTEAAFRRQLEWFEGQGGIVDAREFLDALDAADPPAGRFLLTFDDGLAEHALAGRLLAERERSAFFFVCSRPRRSGRLLNPHRLHLLLGAVGADCLAGEVATLLTDDMFDVDARRRFGHQLYRNQADTAETRLKATFNYHLKPVVAENILGRLFQRHLGPEQPWLDRLYLSDEALRALARDHVIGNHSDAHPVMSSLAPAAQQAEIDAGGAWIEDRTGKRPESFCYPYGVADTYTAETAALLAGSGYRAAFVYDDAEQTWPPSDRLGLSRKDCNRVSCSRS
jgi:peptidoglycan/xylan/chitin deacetylase (PgdA/CDA1 family)